MSQAPNHDIFENLLKQFISFQSVDGADSAKQECVDWVIASFLQNDLESLQKGEVDGSPWLYVKHPDSKLLVFGHIDVVPAPDAMFALQMDGDMARGRGVSDMKGHILPFLMAYKDAVDTGERPAVSILLTTDEETAGRTIPELLQRGVIRGEPAAFTPDSNDLGIVTEHKGGVWVNVVCTGSGGHGAYPWDAKNPFYIYAEAITALSRAFPTGTHDDWQITVTPTTLTTTNAHNQIPAAISAGMDIRYPPEQFASAEEAVATVQKELPDGAVLEVVQKAIPLYTAQDEPMVRLYKEVAEHVLGTDIPFKREHGGTDARNFSAAGIPAFLYGPKGGGLHSQDEWVSLSSLRDHYTIYSKLFTKL